MAETSNKSDFPNGSINFIGHTSGSPARFVVVNKNTDVPLFAESYLQHMDLQTVVDKTTNTQRPAAKVIISVTGGAQGFNMLSSKLEQVFTRGIIRAAQNTAAWIITGALDDGVMKFVGNAMRDQGVEDVPCIGIATYKKVSHYETLNTAGQVTNYAKEKPNDMNSSALNPDHTHFILVDSPKNEWGQEIDFRNEFENYISSTCRIPIVLIVVNGGPGTLLTVAEAIDKGFPVVIVEGSGSGRCADALAAKYRARPGAQVAEWDKFVGTKPDVIAKMNGLLDRIMKKKENISIYNPNTDATVNMDIVILRAILNTGHMSSNFQIKLALSVEWDRPDLIRELLDKDDAADEKTEALRESVQISLALDKAEIFSLLIAHGGRKDMINLKQLYKHASVQYALDRLQPFMANIADADDDQPPTSPKPETALLAGKKNNKRKSVSAVSGKKRLNVARSVLRAVSPMYSAFVDETNASFTDVMVWAIIVDRPDLARSLWAQTGLPIHTALVACHLYKTIGGWLQDEEDYNEYAAWYENKAIEILDETEFETAKLIFQREWAQLQKKTPLHIAQIASCKDFLSHSFVQRYLDELLYTTEKGGISPGTPAIKLIPAMIPFCGGSIYEPASGVVPHFYDIYGVPLIKMCTSTFCYLAFLCVLSATVILTGGPTYHWIEFLLLAMYCANVMEEIKQFSEDPDTYFDLLSNRTDCVMYFLLAVYIGLRIAGVQTGNRSIIVAATDVIMVANIFCYLRLLNIFAFSKNLGPLFFVILRLFKDVFQWVIIFSLFMISFQIAFIATTEQAAQAWIDSHTDSSGEIVVSSASGSGDAPPDKWEGYPTGIMGLTFFTIIGDYGYANDINAQSAIGIPLIAIYALISQVMLVNLLIAMMGSTYGDVKENSTKEWKFYRLTLVEEYSTSSVYPPPFNIILAPITYLINKACPSSRGDYISLPEITGAPMSRAVTRDNPTAVRATSITMEPYQASSSSNLNTSVAVSLPPPRSTTEIPSVKAAAESLATKMKVAKERVLEKLQEQEENKLENIAKSIGENLRVLMTQQDNDRISTTENLQGLTKSLVEMRAQLDALVAPPAAVVPQVSINNNNSLI